ncbi:MAG: hypothetical protein VX246_10550, partial [Myxococcota bacterium]|nr:hypothetical protein [Myxococcota bacterium]
AKRGQQVSHNATLPRKRMPHHPHSARAYTARMRGIVFDGKRSKLRSTLEVRQPALEDAVAVPHAVTLAF